MEESLQAMEELRIIENISSQLQRTQVNFKKCPKTRLTKGYIESKLECINGYWNSIVEAHSSLVKRTTQEQYVKIPYLANNEYDTIEEEYLCLKADLKDLLERLTQPVSTQSLSGSQQKSTYLSCAKLPKIELPTFSGQYEHWANYDDLFTSLVHNDKSLSKVQKLHYLKASVTGEAEALLRHIQVTETNYDQAREILKNRYGNKRLVVNSLLKRLFGQKKCTTQTASQIKTILDTTEECLNGLVNEGLFINSWDPIIIYHVVQKIDLDTHKAWEEYAYNLKQNELPTWRDLKQFLEGKFRTLELVTNTNTPSTAREKNQTHKSKSFHVATPSSVQNCSNCGENHTLSHCKVFGKLQPQERNEFVKNKNLCFNCLVEGHSAWKCRVPVSCRICKRRHHTLLHEKRDSKNTNDVQAHHSQLDDTEDEHKEDEETNDAIATHFTAKKSTALLATALVPVRDERGHITILRALVDQGSQANFISERAAQTLKVKRMSAKGNITGVGSTKTTVKHVVQLEILSRHDDTFKFGIKAYVMATQLTTHLPTKTIKTPNNNWKHLRGLTLADPNFNEVGKIDLLLGVEVCSQILKNELIKGPPGSPCAQHTSLGWILFGAIQDAASSEEIIVMHHHLDLDNMLKNFWEIEPDMKKKYTKEEKECERLFEESYTRNEEGRYVVKLPFKSETRKSQEGNTKDIAMRRLRQLERRFRKDDTLKEEYTKVMEEYKTLNHLEEVPDNEMEKPAVYLPHHAVIRNDKDTSKVRIVFDASAKGSNQISLNDELMVGPQLQEDMRSIIIRWRMKRYCYTADVQMMYRQILVTKEDTDYQRILWPDSTGIIRDYRLLRVTFGTACAPYLAVKTLQQIAKDEGQHHPVAAKTIHEDIFMDDLMSGQDTIPEAVDTAKNITAILKRGGMNLQKWTSNNPEFLKEIEPSKRSSRVSVDIKVDGTTKALGVSWNMGEDKFQYHLQLAPSNDVMTKRTILAEIQRLFDPLGWLAPSLLHAKIIIQKLWLKGVGWDDELDSETKEEWINIRNNYEHLKEIQLKRWMYTTQNNLEEVTIHGFCDASNKAYGAVAYLRARSEDGEMKISLIAARTRVAPVRPVSLPRLELCGAVLLSQLLKQISEATRIPSSQFFAWTDSTIVLSWLEGDPARWQTFVRNRVITIQDNIGNKWFHVRSDENPADLASRGMLLSELRNNVLWWQGPDWLKDEEIPENKLANLTTELEMRKNVLANTKIEENREEKYLLTKFEDFETLTELLKTITYCKRFLKYKNYRNTRLDCPMTTEELDKALHICIKIAQRETFEEEIEDLKKNGRVKRKSNIKSLHPFIDSSDILRVGGRIRHANLNECKKHPIILNIKNSLTSLILEDAHAKTLHGGIQLMLTYLREKYWVINAKRAVKACIHKCLICAKQRAVMRTQLMGDLPRERVNPARAFCNSGVDFAGPYQVLMSRGRGAKTSKSYIAIFVCMATKAIHLELVGDLTSEAFIGAFKRFVARRGKCTNLWSDQGRNFVGANKELAHEWKEAKLEFEGEISEKLALDGTQWHFIPAYSPNFGGLWEAGVKSLKYHLKRILNTHLTYEEMCTVLCQVEACLNSRPLCPVDDTNPESLEILTPGHFLIGEAPTTVPSPTLQFTSMSHLTRWRYTQKLLNEFWTKWQDEYLSRLQQRPKWLKKVEELRIGQIVLIKTDGLPPGKWLLGRIMEKHPGPDNITRVYSVKSGDKIVKRPITKLCLLPIDTES